jgi:hypothetical protein
LLFEKQKNITIWKLVTFCYGQLKTLMKTIKYVVYGFW